MRTQECLSIRRFELAVEAGANEADAVMQRARRALHMRLAPALSARTLTGEGVVLARRVSIELSIGADDPAEYIADRLAEALAAAVDAIESSAETLPGFTSIADHAAAFLAALVDGSAWRRWQFRGFNGVCMLPVGRAASTVLLRDPQKIPEIWARLESDMRARLLALIPEAEATRLLDAICATAPAGVATHAVTNWRTIGALLCHELAGAPAEPGSCGANCERASLAALLAFVTRTGEPLSAEIVATVRLAAAHPVGATHVDSSHAGPQSAWRIPQPLREALIQRDAQDSATDDGARAQWFFSRNGGYALLLPALLDLDLDSCKAWPSFAGCDPRNALLLLTGAAAAGPQTGRAIMADRFWHRLFDLPPRTDAARLAEWVREVGPAKWQGLATSAAAPRRTRLPRMFTSRYARRAVAALARTAQLGLARRLPGFASATPAFLADNLLGSGASLFEATDIVQVRFDRPPLDVLLSITGLAEREVVLPDGRTLLFGRRR